MRAKWDPTGEYEQRIHLNWKNSYNWYNMVKKDLLDDYKEKYKKYNIFNESLDVAEDVKQAEALDELFDN